MAAEVEPSLTILTDVPRAVPLHAARGEDVNHVMATRREQLRDQAAVATPPRGLRAHEARSRLREGRLEGRLPFRCRHAGRVAPERADGDACETLLAGLVAPFAAQLDRVPIFDSSLREHGGEGVTVELRVPSRGGKTADVDKCSDGGAVQTLHQFRRRTHPMADRHDSHRNKMPRSVARRERMAGVITWNRLRELAAFRAQKGLAISLYLGFDSSTAGTIPGAATKINSLLDEAQKSAFATRDDLTHDQKRGLQSDFERIRNYLANDFERAGAQGVAIFASGLDNFWSANVLSDQVPDRVCVAPDFHLRPLVPLLGRGDGAIVAVIDRERGLLFQLTNGRLEPLADLTEEQPGRHDQGGWSQSRYQRHIDELAKDHLRTVAEDLDSHVRRGLARQVVVVGPEEARAAFADLLAPETRNCVVGSTAGEGYATPAELLGLALPFLEQARLNEETKALERWQEEAGRSGRAASGWEQTLEAASDGRVELLLFQEGIERLAYECPSCGRAQIQNGACPLDATRMEPRDDGIDLAVHRTLAHGGSVRALARERRELGPVEGIAALLRY